MTNQIQGVPPVNPGGNLIPTPLAEYAVIAIAGWTLLRNLLARFAADSSEDRSADRKMQWELVQHLIKVNEQKSEQLQKCFELLSETHQELHDLIRHFQSQGGEADG